MNNRELVSFFVSGIISGLLFWAYEVGENFSSHTAILLLVIILVFALGVAFVISVPIYFVLKKYKKNSIVLISIFSMVVSTIILCSFKNLYPWEYPIAPLIGLFTSFIFIWVNKSKRAI